MSDKRDISTQISRGMGLNLHWFPEDVSPAKLAVVMTGMANASGGVILLGISPRSGHILGVSDPSEAVDRIFQAALLTDPPLVLPIPSQVRTGGIDLISLTIPSGLPHVYSLEGRYLGREGIQTNPLPARRLRQLLIERGVVQFESQIPPDAALDDLDPLKISAYVEKLQLPGNTSPEEILLRRGCLKREGSVLRPTYAALLLFGRHCQQWLPNATLLAARFTGVTFADCFVKQDIGGTLPEQLRQAEAFVRENVRSVVRMVGLAHQETPEFPFEAVRELLVNAIAHRDYNQQGDNIHLNIFADRIEVRSPGGLPGPVNLENLLEARFSRNLVIVQVLSDLGYVERLGYGLDRVVNVVRQNGLRPPRFEDVAGSFRVTLYGEPLAAFGDLKDRTVASEGSLSRISDPIPDLESYREIGLNSRQELALGFLFKHRRITNSDYQGLCPDVHSETLRRDLSDLVGRGVLIKVGDKRATYYILK
jgi:ATP-dependent DNA helicase RecG